LSPLRTAGVVGRARSGDCLTAKVVWISYPTVPRLRPTILLAVPLIPRGISNGSTSADSVPDTEECRSV
jgi:hypothetical protein